MMDVQFIVRWSAGNKAHYRVYDDESVARQAKRSIKENREDWLTYFGIKEEA